MALSLVKSVWNYRGFILGNVKREFQSKYKNSLLGIIWNILNPLAMIIVYTVIFSNIMKSKLPGISSQYSYSIYLCAGVLIWGLFSEIVTRSQNVFIDNANLIKKLNFPRICLPIIIIAGAILNFVIIFSIFTLFLIISNNFPGIHFIALLPIIFILVFFSIGLGITIGVLNVFFRDIGQFFGIIIQFWFWLTPIVYTINILPPRIVQLMNYNPMTGIINSCQKILVENVWPTWSTLIPAILSGFVFSLASMYLFRKHSGEMVDEL